MVTFVLVHGTGHGGWCWRLLTPLLRAAGYDVYAPTLTGLGASSHLLEQINKVTLDTHVTDILNLLFYEDLSEVVLLGHSYGGMVITGVAKKESRRLSHLIYLDAYLPLEGENEIDLWPAEQKQRYYIDLEAGLNSRAPMPSSMLGITDSKISDWVQERLTPHPYSTYEGAPISSSDNGIENNSIPRTFIHCTSGPLSSWMEPFAIRARTLKWNTHTISAGHDVMITKPEDLAKILLQIVK